MIEQPPPGAGPAVAPTRIRPDSLVFCLLPGDETAIFALRAGRSLTEEALVALLPPRAAPTCLVTDEQLIEWVDAVAEVKAQGGEGGAVGAYAVIAIRESDGATFCLPVVAESEADAVNALMQTHQELAPALCLSDAQLEELLDRMEDPIREEIVRVV